MKFVLRRLNITGPVDEFTTPIDVLSQCMSSHGLEPDWGRLYDIHDISYRRKCIAKLIECPPIVIRLDEESPSRREFGRAVRYINHKTSFTDTGKLVRCLERLAEWELGDVPATEGNYGPITQTGLENIDCTMVYKLCRERGLKTRPDHGLRDMCHLLRLEKLPPERLRDLFVDRLHVMSSGEILNMFERMIPGGFDFSWGSFFELYPVRRDVDTCIDPLGLKFPRTNHEAVIMAAKNYKVNILGASHPMLEYALLARRGVSERSFPIDSSLQDKLNHDPYSLRIDQRFFPDLPEYVYQLEDVRKMAVEEGWEEDSRIPPYDFLKRVYHEPTFFAYGRGPMTGVVPVNETLKIELTPYIDEDPLNLVLWGKRDSPQTMICFAWSELCMTFETYKDFRNPLSKTLCPFEDFAIRKLAILSRKPCINRLVADRRKRLSMVIEKIITANREQMEIVGGIRESLLRNPDQCSHMMNLLSRLFLVSLSMRSFTDNPEEFLRGGGGGHLDMETTERNVGVRLVDLQQYMGEIDPNTRQMFLDLPIVIYHPKEGKFSTCEETFEGYTIGGRLKLVYEGEGTTAMSSCLRLSSNWFLSSVYYYDVEFGFEPPFDITHLTHIG